MDITSVYCICVLYSGISKSIFSEQKLVANGQTGVEGLPLALIRLIGITEILGAAGIILPLLLSIYPNLTAIAAFCLGLIMIPAGIIHYKRNEMKDVITNVVIFFVCMFIAYKRYI